MNEKVNNLNLSRDNFSVKEGTIHFKNTPFKKVLLLNASYEPIKVISWERAMVLWFCEKVEILEYHNLFVRSARSRFQLPSVLKLKTYVYPNHLRHVRFSRENIYLRDNYTRQYCGKKFTPNELTLDHVVPVSKLGPKNWQNLVSACRRCNQIKADRTPQAAGMKLLKEPLTPKWLPSLELDPQFNSFPDSWLNYFQLKTS
jgi:5-methylcytosine-specific restriction endonuclease McrA